jgi:hypothetical protein
MKKTLFGFIAASLLMITSCQKPEPLYSGAWSFKNVTYPNLSTVIDTAVAFRTIETDNSSTSNLSTYGTLTVQFYGTFPPQAGTYLVDGSAYTHQSDHVFVTATTGGGTQATDYQSTGTGSSPRVVVSISNNHISLSGTGIELVNGLNPNDTGAVNLNFASVLIY